MCDSQGVSRVEVLVSCLSTDMVLKGDRKGNPGVVHAENVNTVKKVLTLPNAAIHDVQFRHQPGRFFEGG